MQCLHFKLPQPMNMNVAERQREFHSQLLSSHDAQDLLNSVDAFLFDCDGLIPLTFNFNFHSSSLYTHIYFWISISIFVMCIEFTKNTAGFCFYRCDMEGWYTHRWSLTDIRYASLQGTHTHSFSFSNFFFFNFYPKILNFLLGCIFYVYIFFRARSWCLSPITPQNQGDSMLKNSNPWEFLSLRFVSFQIHFFPQNVLILL